MATTMPGRCRPRNGNTIGDASSLTVSGVAAVLLNFSGTETGRQLIVNSQSFAIGTDSVTDLGGEFFGTGTITVVPKPATLAILPMVSGLLLAHRRRRNTVAR